MTVTSSVIAETGLDLSDPKIVENKLAPQLADRLTNTFPAFSEARRAVSAIMTNYKALTSTPTVLGAVGIAVQAVGAAAGYLEGRLDKDIAGNMKRWEEARNRTIERWVKPGDWSTVLYANGVEVGKVDLHNNALGWDESDFLAQYNDGVVWMSHRTARSDILLPTWDSPPFTNGYGFISADKGIDFPRWSPLTGFTIKGRKHCLGQPGVGPIPKSYDETYFGTLPSPTLGELADAGLEGAPKFLQSLIVKMEAAFYNQAFVPPPDYRYLFSIGTYPYTSWSTANNGMPGSGGSVTLNRSMAALAAGIHSLSPIHALVRSVEVEKCYRAWLSATRIRLLPPIPSKQVESGVYLDAQGLPWSPSRYAVITCVEPARGPTPAPKYQFEKDNQKRCAADPKLANIAGSGCLPANLWATNYSISWEVARDIELSFRSFFALRRAALYQMEAATQAFRDAAVTSSDSVLAAAAQGKPPEYSAWSFDDPLSDGWNKKSGFQGADDKIISADIPADPPPRRDPLPPRVIEKESTLARVAVPIAAVAVGLAALGYRERAQLQAWVRRIARRVRGRR